MSDIVQIENLIFKYISDIEEETITAIKDITLNVEEGSFVAVIGSNGSGKSTLAKNINALVIPSSGNVIVDGYNTKEQENIWNVRQAAGMVFQNPDNQIVSSIVEDDVAFGPENLGIDPKIIRKRVDEALDSVKMGQFRKKAPHLLSGGQKQRIAIAGAIAMRPKCIIFDEPTAMLDPKGRKEVMTIIKRLNNEGITCILITHFMEEAAQAERIVIMDKGKIRLDDTPKKIFQNIDDLKEMSLDVPMVVELADRLRKKGFDIPSDIIEEKELVEAICQYM